MKLVHILCPLSIYIGFSASLRSQINSYTMKFSDLHVSPPPPSAMKISLELLTCTLRALFVETYYFGFACEDNAAHCLEFAKKKGIVANEKNSSYEFFRVWWIRELWEEPQ